ncbi:hypothetical protein N8I77_004818 [Diaporthe amygdali]|uniref:Uncharacterized protein n=1 Tax=Phomopsis amygdali TaxID=1214568 RepID=A0AAD9W6D7_PHOAM|nr:hypothetical protein N8I77_004818 [Diaporthe amygdali]
MPQEKLLHDALVAPEISTAAAKSRRGLDVIWGYDRRPVSMALLRARRKRGLALILGFQTAERKATTTDNSHTTFSSFDSCTTRKQTQTHKHTTQDRRHGELFDQRRGACNAQFFSLVHFAEGRHITHHTRFLWWWRRTEENSLYHTTSIPRIFVRCCTCRPEQQLTSGHQHNNLVNGHLQFLHTAMGFLYFITGIQETGTGVASCPHTQASAFCHAYLAFYWSYSLSDGTLYILHSCSFL